VLIPYRKFVLIDLLFTWREQCRKDPMEDLRILRSLPQTIVRELLRDDESR